MTNKFRLLVCIFVLVSGCLGLAGEGDVRISVSVKDQPMKVALKKLSEASGVEVVVSERDRWLAEWPVSLTLTNGTLDQGIKRLLGNLNYMLTNDQLSGKVVRITIRADMPVATNKDVSAMPPVPKPNMPPPIPPKETLLLDSAEIIPPDAKGGKGVTIGQIKAVHGETNAACPDVTHPKDRAKNE